MLTRGAKQTHIIAEMACSHDGSAEHARTIINAAGRAGANAVQFQIWEHQDIMVPHHPDFDKLRSLQLSYETWSELVDYVRERHPDLEIVACVYEQRSVDFCEKAGVDAYKLHSADVSNPLLLEYVAQTNRRIDLSVGASTLDEIRAAVTAIRRRSNAGIWMMYGYQNFPTRTDEVHLRYMMKLKELFELPIGYQDHTDAEREGAFWLPTAAIGLGVDILEKHITHDRSLRGADHEAALNPDEFERFVEMVRTVDGAMGVATPRPFSEEEEKYRRYAKKSLVARRDLPAGTQIGPNDLLFMRAPELGLPPDQADRVVGRKTRQAVPAYDLVREEDVA